jgi:hypothetical protein
MLSAKVEEDQLSSDSPIKSSFSVDGVRNVVTSIEGLQHRVNNFTPEQITKAEGEIHALLSSITEIAQRLEVLSGIHRRLTSARKSLAEADSNRSGLTEFDVLQPMLLQIANCTTTIRSRSEIRASLHESVSKDSIETQLEANDSDFAATEVGRGDAATDDKAEDAQSINASKASGGLPLLASPKLLHEVIESESIDEQAEIISIKTGSTESNTETERTAKFENIPRPDILSDGREHSPDTENPILEAQFDNRAASDFDQQLLDDLIKNYGEFASFSQPDAGLEPQLHGTVDFQFTTEKRATLITEPSAVPSTPSGSHPPIPARKEGELDVRLKKLIKDYGENDLYSRETPIKVKTGVIGALILLAAILSGFYFLSSPKSVLPEPNASVSPLTSTSESTDTSANSDHLGIDVSQTKTNAKNSRKN